MMHDGNMFTDFFEKILEASRWDTVYKDRPYDKYTTKTITEKKKVFLFFHKMVTKEVSVPIPVEDIKEDLISDLIEFYGILFPITDIKKTARTGDNIQAFTKKAVTFKMLWDFCDFVKLAEYVIFYPNSEKGDFYVKAADYQFKKYKEDDIKSIYIKGTDTFDLEVVLEEVEDPYNSNTMHTIKLIIDRKNTGKQTIVCIDEVSDDNIDCKDTMLLTNLSDFICESCYNIFKDITNSIIDGSGVKLE